jgi:hypothetical protein
MSASSSSLRPTISKYFIGDMMPDSDSPGQQGLTIIEIRPFRGGFEAPGVAPCWIGPSAKEGAIGYAKARAKFGRGEIRVLRPDGSVERSISFDETDAKM